LLAIALSAFAQENARGPLYENFLAADALLGRVSSATGEAPAHTIDARGVLRDESHPKHFGDFSEEPLRVQLAVNAALHVALHVEGEEKPAHVVVSDRAEIVEGADEAGPLRAIVAKLDPLFVLDVVRNDRRNLQLVDHTLLFAARDGMWRIHVDGETNLLDSLETAVAHDQYGDLTLTIRYEQWRDRGGFRFPSRITATLGGRPQVSFDVLSVSPSANVPAVAREKGDHAIAGDAISFRELAPHLFSIDLAATNSRVIIAEFGDFVMVIEGAYDSRNGDLLADRIRERFKKPIRYFSFSHIHGQYAGSTRSFIARDATIVTTKTGAEAVRNMAASRHRYRPDALMRKTVPAKIEEVAASRTIEDATNAVTLFNVESQHTDDYLIFYFPRQRVLLSGDLFCLRETQPLRGRSIKFCETVKSLGIAVDTIVITWPLAEYGCAPVVKAEDFAKGCAAVKATVLFLCPYGGAKSVIAASYFNRLAEQQKLPFEAIAAAAEEPYAAVPPPVADFLEKDGFSVRTFHPRHVDAADFANARKVVSIDCDLSKLDSHGATIERWDDVPKVSADLPGSVAAIRKHVEELVETLK